MPRVAPWVKKGDAKVDAQGNDLCDYETEELYAGPQHQRRSVLPRAVLRGWSLWKG